jgi:hypothetical protein
MEERKTNQHNQLASCWNQVLPSGYDHPDSGECYQKFVPTHRVCDESWCVEEAICDKNGGRDKPGIL